MKNPLKQRKMTMGTKLYLRSILSIILLNLVLFPIRAVVFTTLALVFLLVVLMKSLTLWLISSLIPAQLKISQQDFLDEELEYDPARIKSNKETAKQWTFCEMRCQST